MASRAEGEDDAEFLFGDKDSPEYQQFLAFFNEQGEGENFLFSEDEKDDDYEPLEDGDEDNEEIRKLKISQKELSSLLADAQKELAQSSARKIGWGALPPQVTMPAHPFAWDYGFGGQAIEPSRPPVLIAPPPKLPLFLRIANEGDASTIASGHTPPVLPAKSELTTDRRRRIAMQMCQHFQLLLQMMILSSKSKVGDVALQGFFNMAHEQVLEIRNARDNAWQRLQPGGGKKKGRRQEEEGGKRGRLSSGLSCSLFDIPGLTSLDDIFNKIDKTPGTSSGNTMQEQAKEVDACMKTIIPNDVLSQNLLLGGGEGAKAHLKFSDMSAVGRMTFTEAENRLLIKGLRVFGEDNFKDIKEHLLPTKSIQNLIYHFRNMTEGEGENEDGSGINAAFRKYLDEKKKPKPAVKGGSRPFTKEEDDLLWQTVLSKGRAWNYITEYVLVGRGKTETRRRWLALKELEEKKRMSQWVPIAPGGGPAPKKRGRKRKTEEEKKATIAKRRKLKAAAKKKAAEGKGKQQKEKPDAKPAKKKKEKAEAQAKGEPTAPASSAPQTLQDDGAANTRFSFDSHFDWSMGGTGDVEPPQVPRRLSNRSLTSLDGLLAPNQGDAQIANASKEGGGGTLPPLPKLIDTGGPDEFEREEIASSSEEEEEEEDYEEGEFDREYIESDLEEERA